MGNMEDMEAMNDNTYAAAHKWVASGKTITAWAKGAAPFLGRSEEDLVSSYEARAKKEALSEDSATLAEFIETFKVSRTLLSRLVACKRFKQKHGVTPRIDWLLNADETEAVAILVLSKGSKGSKGSKEEKGEKKGRVSAWSAYLKHNNDEAIVIKKNDNGTYTDQSFGQNVVVTRERRGLVGYCLRQYPESNWAKELGKFPGNTL